MVQSISKTDVLSRARLINQMLETNKAESRYIVEFRQGFTVVSIVTHDSPDLLNGSIVDSQVITNILGSDRFVMSGTKRECYKYLQAILSGLLEFRTVVSLKGFVSLQDMVKDVNSCYETLLSGTRLSAKAYKHHDRDETYTLSMGDKVIMSGDSRYITNHLIIMFNTLESAIS